MNLTRRTFLSWIPAGLCAATFGKFRIQDKPRTEQPSQAGQPVQSPQPAALPGLAADLAIENAASLMKRDDPQSVRAVVEAIFKFRHSYQVPEVIASVVKQRLINAQIAYLDGRTAGTAEGNVVDALNRLTVEFALPAYGAVSLLQVQLTRVRCGTTMPVFMRSNTGLDIKLGEPNPPMSPLQTIETIATLIDEKLLAPDFQVPPAEWDRDVYPRLAEQQRVAEEVRRRIAAGEVQSQMKARMTLVSTSDDLRHAIQRRISSMPVADGLKQFNQTLTQLGI